jgi:hypothetical protein
MLFSGIKRWFQPPPTCDKLFALVGCQRTGTHFLREIMNTNPAVAVMAEVFSNYPRPVYWHNFVRSLPKRRYPPLLPPDAMALLDEYVQVVQRDIHIRSDWYGGPKPALEIVGFDVKYNQLKCVAPVFSDLRVRPFLFDYFRQRGVRVIHMVRKNLLQTALSIIIANLRSVWQNYDGRLIEGRFQISPRELLMYMRWIREERDEFCRLGHDLSVHSCGYEDLAGDVGRVDAEGNFPADSPTLSAIATFLGVPNTFRFKRNIHKAINRPYAEIIENYDELVRAVDESEFAEFTKAA